MIYPFEQAKEVLKLFRDLTTRAPDELAADAALMSLPDGVPVAGIVICYNGPIEEGERVIKPLREFGPPIMGEIGPMPYTAVQRMIDDPYPSGLQNYWKSNFMSELNDEAIDTLVAHCANRPSPMCHGLIEFQLGGAISRVGEEETAFNHRDVDYTFLALGSRLTQRSRTSASGGRGISGRRCGPSPPRGSMSTTWARRAMREWSGSRLLTAPKSTNGWRL